MRPPAPETGGLMLDSLPRQAVTSRRSILFAFLGSGAIWISGVTLAVHGIGLGLFLVAAAYVTLSSLLLASRLLRIGPALLTLWVLTVLPITTVGYLADAGLWLPPVLGVFYGSLLFAPWCLTGLFLLHVLTGGAKGGPSPDALGG